MMSISTPSKSSMMCRPWTLFRLVGRGIFFALLAWILLTLLWAFIPSPTAEQDGDNGTDYPTAVLRAGKTLTRVYYSSSFAIPQNHRSGFAMDYKLDIKSLHIDIGWHTPLPLTIDYATLEGYGNFTEQIEVSAKNGDTDGVNMPWFTFADSVLLYSCIQETDLNFPVLVQWSRGKDDVARMEVNIAIQHEIEVNERISDITSAAVIEKNKGFTNAGARLFALEMKGKDISTITATVPETRLSSSPSKTYFIRLALIHIIAPTALLVADVFGNAFGSIIEATIIILFAVLVYGFLMLAVIFSLWRCLGGPSFEETVERLQSHLEKLSENDRLRFLGIDDLRMKLDVLCQNQIFKATLDICRNGWHPERDRASAADEEVADTEKGLKGHEASEIVQGKEGPRSL